RVVAVAAGGDVMFDAAALDLGAREDLLLAGVQQFVLGPAETADDEAAAAGRRGFGGGRRRSAGHAPPTSGESRGSGPAGSETGHRTQTPAAAFPVMPFVRRAGHGDQPRNPRRPAVG